MAGHRAVSPRRSEDGRLAAPGRTRRSDGAIHARRAAAAAVSATLSAAVVTISTEAAHVVSLAPPSRSLTPAAMEALTPASLERPTADYPVSTRPVPTRPGTVRTVVSKAPSTRTLASRSVPAASRTAPARTGRSIGRRRVEPVVVPADAEKRAVAASIGDLHLSERAARPLR